MNSHNLDFSFSGLKTAVLRYVRENQLQPVNSLNEVNQPILDLVASFQDKVIRSLISRLKEGARRHEPRTIILSGGVACNSALRQQVKSEDFNAPVYYPSPVLTTDNAAMIAAAGYPKLVSGKDDGVNFQASASLKLENFVLEGYEPPMRARYRI
jgi:N6-L-threonylcarbamoyladenine synthase